MVCEMTVTGQGASALDFVEEKLLMLFGDSAGNGVEEYSVRITLPVITRDIAVSDKLHWGDREYRVTAVGDEAMETLRLLGHCTLRFDGSTEAVLPGSIHLEDAEMPEIAIGSKIYFD
ncbi:MAG: PTS sorbitol transporter subunit IIA [Ruminococcaceae bacterium]|nr:PTS sorbitol transporter subunit IIA [Oscillospiraceae bacterium]